MSVRVRPQGRGEHERLRRVDDHDLIYVCPGCGFFMFSDLNSFEGCPLCGWVANLPGLRYPTMDVMGQGSMVECQKAFADRLVKEGRQRWDLEYDDGYVFDPGWRPLDPTIHNMFQPLASSTLSDERGYFDAEGWATDPTLYYWWRW